MHSPDFAQDFLSLCVPNVPGRSRFGKRQFGYLKVRYRGVMKNTDQLATLFSVSNLWLADGDGDGDGELRVQRIEIGLKARG